MQLKVDRSFCWLVCGIAGFLGSSPNVAYVQRHVEALGPGTVATRRADGVIIVPWRLMATDPAGIRYHLAWRVGGGAAERLTPTPIEVSGWEDRTALPDRDIDFEVIPVASTGNDLPPGRPAQLARDDARPSREVPVQPEAGYVPNVASVGDLDGDGDYEPVVHTAGRERDYSQDGLTDPPILDAYRLDGTRLRSIRLGRNIREGAHYTQFLVFDLDGDGRTGVALATVHDSPSRGAIGGWSGAGGNGGNGSVGNRADRSLACVALLGGQRPSLVFCRGDYGRTVLEARDFRERKLANRWIFASNQVDKEFAGQGNHNLSVADIDDDDRDEMIYGSMVVADNGRGLFSTGLHHGNTLRVGDLDPVRPGLKVYGVHEDVARARNKRPGTAMDDARTGAILWTNTPGVDVVRGLAADLDPRQRSDECWGGPGGLRTARGKPFGKSPRSVNFAVWWDGDALPKILDGTRVTRWDPATMQKRTLFVAEGLASNNESKATPALSADLWSDWREEVVLHAADHRSLRISTTTIPTTIRLPTLMHAPQYRPGMVWQNVDHNQPPHPSFLLGAGFTAPPHTMTTPPARHAC